MPASNPPSATLTAAQRPDGRLLIMLAADETVTSSTAVAKLRQEGWSVLCIQRGPDTDAAAERLLAAVHGADGKIDDPAKLVFVAESGTAALASRTLELWHRRGTLPRTCGLVTIDAEDLAVESLAAIETLATLIAAGRHAAAARSAGLAYHRALQAHGRDSRFMVVTDALSPADQLADPAQPLGRELRWLVDPVHSRTEPA